MSVLDLELPESLQTSETQPAPAGALAKGPRPRRTYNARTMRHELAKPDARKAKNKAQRQARKANR